MGPWHKWVRQRKQGPIGHEARHACAGIVSLPCRALHMALPLLCACRAPSGSNGHDSNGWPPNLRDYQVTDKAGMRTCLQACMGALYTV